MLNPSLGQLDQAYRTEQDGDVKERILPVRRVRFDRMDASKVAERDALLPNSIFLSFTDSFSQG